MVFPDAQHVGLRATRPRAQPVHKIHHRLRIAIQRSNHECMLVKHLAALLNISAAEDPQPFVGENSRQLFTTGFIGI